MQENNGVGDNEDIVAVTVEIGKLSISAVMKTGLLG